MNGDNKNFAATGAELSIYETARVVAFEHGAVTAAACLSAALCGSGSASAADAWAIKLGYEQGDDCFRTFCQGFAEGEWGKPMKLRLAARAAVKALDERKAAAGVTFIGRFEPRLVANME